MSSGIRFGGSVSSEHATISPLSSSCSPIANGISSTTSLSSSSSSSLPPCSRITGAGVRTIISTAHHDLSASSPSYDTFRYSPLFEMSKMTTSMGEERLKEKNENFIENDNQIFKNSSKLTSSQFDLFSKSRCTFEKHLNIVLYFNAFRLFMKKIWIRFSNLNALSFNLKRKKNTSSSTSPIIQHCISDFLTPKPKIWTTSWLKKKFFF